MDEMKKSYTVNVYKSISTDYLPEEGISSDRFFNMLNSISSDAIIKKITFDESSCKIIVEVEQGIIYDDDEDNDNDNSTFSFWSKKKR